MTIKGLIESAKFPIHKSGGYQVSAVDELLVKVISQSDALDESLKAVNASEAALKSKVNSLSTELDIARSRIAALEAEVSELEASPQAPDNDTEMDTLRIRISSLEIELDEFQEAVKKAELQAIADEEHIASLEKYADEVEVSVSSIRAERDKIKHDAEVAIRSLQERLLSVKTSPTSVLETQPELPDTLPEESLEDKVSLNHFESDLLDEVEPEAESVQTSSVVEPTSEPTSPPVRPRLMRRS